MTPAFMAMEIASTYEDEIEDFEEDNLSVNFHEERGEQNVMDESANVEWSRSACSVCNMLDRILCPQCGRCERCVGSCPLILPALLWLP